MLTGWIALGAIFVGATLFGFIVAALFASNAYERGRRDALNDYARSHSEW